MTRPLAAVVSTRGRTTPVLAQVPALLAAVRAAGREVTAVVLAPSRGLIGGRGASHARVRNALRAATGVETIDLTGNDAAREGRRLSGALSKRGFGNAVLLCRGEDAALLGIAARRGTDALRVVLDLRGDSAAEHLARCRRPEDELSRSEAAELENLRTRQRDAAAGADAVICASTELARVVSARHDLPRAKFTHLPALAAPVANAEELRTRARKRLRVRDDQLLLATSSSLEPWHLADETVLLVRALAGIRPGARLLFVTPAPGRAKSALRRVGYDRAIVRSTAPGEVDAVLAAADDGLVLRRSDDVSRVACPLAFGEYLALGVRPVLTPGIGDQSQACNQNTLGILVSQSDVERAANSILLDTESPTGLGPEGRARRRRWASEHIAPSKIAGRLLAVVDDVD